MIKSSMITNRLSITMAGLIIDYLFSSDLPEFDITRYPRQMTTTTDVLCHSSRLVGWEYPHNIFSISGCGEILHV